MLNPIIEFFSSKSVTSAELSVFRGLVSCVTFIFLVTKPKCNCWWQHWGRHRDTNGGSSSTGDDLWANAFPRDFYWVSVNVIKQVINPCECYS